MTKKHGSYVHADGSLRFYKDGFLHREDGPAIICDYTKPHRSGWFKKVEYFLDGKEIINWDDPDPKVQALKQYKELQALLEV